LQGLALGSGQRLSKAVLKSAWLSSSAAMSGVRKPVEAGRVVEHRGIAALACTSARMSATLVFDARCRCRMTSAGGALKFNIESGGSQTRQI
jgi:hypothetical protein